MSTAHTLLYSGVGQRVSEVTMWSDLEHNTLQPIGQLAKDIAAPMRFISPVGAVSTGRSVVLMLQMPHAVEALELGTHEDVQMTGADLWCMRQWCKSWRVWYRRSLTSLSTTLKGSVMGTGFQKSA